MMVAAKTMASTTVDLFTDPSHIQKAKAEFDQKRGPNFVLQDAPRGPQAGAGLSEITRTLIREFCLDHEGTKNSKDARRRTCGACRIKNREGGRPQKTITTKHTKECEPARNARTDDTKKRVIRSLSIRMCISVVSGFSRSRVSCEAEFQVSPDVRPLRGEDAVHHRVEHGASRRGA